MTIARVIIFIIAVFLQCMEGTSLVLHYTCMCLCGQLNVIPVMFCCAPGAVRWRGGDVCKAGLADISLVELGGTLAVLRKQTEQQKNVTFVALMTNPSNK